MVLLGAEMVVMITVMMVAAMGVVDGSGNDAGDGCYRWWGCDGRVVIWWR